MSSEKEEILNRALNRQKKARLQAEKILEDKSRELYNTSLELKKVNAQLESLLGEKNSQLQGVFENINDAYLVMDLEGNVIKMNDVAEKFFEFTLEEEDVNVVDLIYYEDYEYAMASFTQLTEKGRFADYNARIITKNKNVKWVNINASVIFDKDNNPIAAQGIIRDVTSQREKQLVLDLINDTAKSILGKEDVNEIAWEITNKITGYLNTDNCVVYLINSDTKFLEPIATYNTDKINDRPKLSVGEGILGSVAKSGISEIINDTSLEDRYISFGKEKLSIISVPIINDKEIIGVIDARHTQKDFFKPEQINTLESVANLVAMQLKSALNLIERKKAEKDNADLLSKLAKSNEELKEYAHIVSHDLKSPLRSISALTSWIKMDNADVFDKDSLQNFNDIETTLEKMDALITDVLKFSSLDATVNEEDEVDLDVMVKEVIKMLYVPLNITINIQDKLPVIKGDKTKFQQLFQNLIGNAIKFNDKENGFININVKDLKSFYKFTISDNGIGIEQRNFDKIFKIFQSLKQSENSSGIGLSIVKKIVDIYNGEIWLESELNKGTTFHFTLKK
ncbi:ATP-binding protein [Polaribacter sp. MED152]|uniref:GAF domain-containing sensor histidine kinase n=1 Tax=Polaribacter sp. MED152 TaxID=313598 RepID=UPI000068C5B8|nr:ATP-binding protein [Polaribacter sp. MED152]EAQ41678.1 two-component system sensor histidine kinase [Polaribacter sp. MED152]